MTSTAGADASLYPRSWENGASPYDLSVMQFNILAEGLSSPPSHVKTPPFAFKKDSTFGGFTRVPHPEAVFDYELRMWRIIEAIDDVSPCLLALQECDRFPDFFGPTLSSLGYDSHFCPKKVSPSLQFGYFSDGVGLFWKREKFDCKWFRKGQLDAGGAYVIVHLQEKAKPERDILAVTCHLKAKEESALEDRRVTQMAEILSRVQRCLTLSRSQQVVLMGDFNAVPTDVDATKDKDGSVLKEGYHPKLVQSLLAWREPQLHSAFPITGEEVMEWFSTWKWRGDKETKRMIDYIWATGGLKLVSRLKPPPKSAMKDHGLPALGWPSDHLSFVARYSWVHEA